jgi:hypothetical protein
LNLIADSITAAFLWGTIASAIVFLLGVAIIVDGWRLNLSGAPAAGAGIMVLIAVIWIWASWPIAHNYHWWQEREGVVAEKSSRYIGEFVVRLRGSGQAVTISDTRASLLRPGDRVRLACKKANEFGIPRAAHGWECRWLGNAKL